MINIPFSPHTTFVYTVDNISQSRDISDSHAKKSQDQISHVFKSDRQLVNSLR